MKKLVFFPSDPIIAYINKGKSYEYLDGYYNPGGYFDEVYCLSPWGEKEREKIGNITYIRDNPCRYKKIIKQINPDVVRGYGGYCCADWISISKVKGIPYVASVHDTNPDLIHESLRYADYIICMAECVKQAVLNKITFDRDKICVMPNRVDIELFSKKKDDEYFNKLTRRFGTGKHILHVGRKCEQKNLDTLIKSLEYLTEDVTCIFVGSGEWKEYYNLAKKCDVEQRCFFVERVNEDELPFWYSWCDCFCTPSRWEGFGIVFIEAASCETAIVTSNIAPMNEYLTAGINAVLVDEYENPQILANAINSVLSGGGQVNEMKKMARKVGMKFTKEKIDEQEVEIYKKVIGLGANNAINREAVFRIKTWLHYR